MNEAKPFCISKHAVWEAYKRVKANQGAAGVDGQSISQFEESLKSNLYKLWNRMSSGSYFPPAVRRVDIPKDGKGDARVGYTDGRGSYRASGSQRVLGARVREAFSRRLLRVSPWEIGD